MDDTSMVIQSPSQHNAIIGRPGIRKIRAVPSTAHGMLKFPVEGGTVTLQSSRVIPMECAMIFGSSIQSPTKKGRERLCFLWLKQNLDIFAWKPADMTGVPRNIAEHRLNIREGYSPVRQKKKRGQHPERNKSLSRKREEKIVVLNNEIVNYHSWLSNPVMVKKHDGTWRMCVDFKDLNNACPKDCYPLPENRLEGGIPLWEGMFLGYKVCTNRLRACPDKADVVLSLPSPRCIKDVQKLNGKLASLNSSEISGRMLKWKFELEGYDIQYRPRTAIKGQILADFIVERPEEESPDELMAEPEVLPEPWTLFTDGSSCVDGSGAGLILTNPEGAEFTYAMRFRFEATNNEAEYEALIAGLRIAEQMGVKNLQAHVDSRLVANQVNGSYIAKESGMVQYLNKVKTLAKSFKEFSIKQIPRSENKKADALSKIASTSFAHLNKQVLVEELKEKSINEKEILDVVEEEGNTWMTPICEYLANEILSEDKNKARAVRRKAARLDERSKDWIEELPHVLWAHRTMIKSSNGETPFSLTYGTEAVIPAEIGMPTLRTAEIDLTKNNEALGMNLDLIEERREQAAIQEAKSKKKMEKYYNSRVRGTSFKPGDMVYRSNEASHARHEGKLGPKWEGPYEVKESLGKGAYKLKDHKGNEMPRTWNICNLKKCYILEV
ncbi:reverse transcriptase domain-containing protein [Tanacetum coccineum]